MQFRRVIDYLEGICILHNDPGIAQNLEITEQKSELTITNLNIEVGYWFGLLALILLAMSSGVLWYVIDLPFTRFETP